jgi:hypothetical protein
MRVLVNTGDVFGNFTVLKELEQKGNLRMFLFRCVCGKEVVRPLGQVKGLFLKSCGCLRPVPIHSLTHGMTGTRIYRIWQGIKNRCYNKNRKAYKNYGGRGISVCNEWMHFEPFMKWSLLSGYTDDLSIERIDFNGNYEPDNCKWITFSQQASNKRNVNIIEIGGIRKCMAEWCRIYNVPISRVIARKKYGWDLVKALTVPANPRKRKQNYEA